MTCKGCPNLERIEALERMVDSRLPPEDRRLLEKLLPALAGRFGNESFCSWQVLCDPALADMVGGDAVKTGMLLSRVADSGIAFDGFTIKRDNKKRGNARQWRVLQKVG